MKKEEEKQSKLVNFAKVLFWVQLCILIFVGLSFLILFASSNAPRIIVYLNGLIFLLEIPLILVGFILSILLLINKEIKNKKWGLSLLIISIIFLVLAYLVFSVITRVQY